MKISVAVIIPSFKREKDLKSNIIYWSNELSEISHDIIIGNSSEYIRLKDEFESNTHIQFLDLPDSCWWTDSVNEAILVAKNIESTHIIITNDDMSYPKGLINIFLNNIRKYPDTIFTIPQISNSGDIYYGANISKIFRSFKGLKSIQKNTYIEITNGSCLFIPIYVFNLIGSFNAKNFPHYSADIEFMVRCLRNNIKLLLIDTTALIQGPSTEFSNRFSFLSIYFHKGSPFYYKAFLSLGKILYHNYFNMFFGQGILYSLKYFLGTSYFQMKKIISGIF